MDKHYANLLKNSHTCDLGESSYICWGRHGHINVTIKTANTNGVTFYQCVDVENVKVNPETLLNDTIALSGRELELESCVLLVSYADLIANPEDAKELFEVFKINSYDPVFGTEMNYDDMSQCYVPTAKVGAGGSSRTPILWRADDMDTFSSVTDVSDIIPDVKRTVSVNALNAIYRQLQDKFPPVDLEAGEERFIAVSIGSRKYIYNRNSLGYNGATKYSLAVAPIALALAEDAPGDSKVEILNLDADANTGAVFIYSDTAEEHKVDVPPVPAHADAPNFETSGKTFGKGSGIFPTLDGLTK